MWPPSRARSALEACLVAVVAAACGDAAGTGGGPVLGAGPAAQEAPRARRWTAPSDRDLIDPGIGEVTTGRHELYWTRAIYSGFSRRWYRPSWATDYPKGDRQFLVVLKRLVRLDAYDWENAVNLSDPDLRRFPLLYAVEVGYMDLTQDEVRGLRDYLDAGGMLLVDDFWGTRQWAQFEYNMRRVLPGRPIVELPLEHPLFSAYYQIDEVKQVPARGRGINGRPTWEGDGYVPRVLGIFDDEGRLMVVINWNTDLGDAWEWAEDPMYPLEYSTYAYEMGANMIVYGMSH